MNSTVVRSQEKAAPIRPRIWEPPVELSPSEQKIVHRIKRAKLFVFLREVRHELFDESFQEELGGMYALAFKGHPPIPPAQLALTTILQAYTGASDAEAIEALTMDRRWQLVLDCLDAEVAPFSQTTLVRFRQALMIHQLDRHLIEKTIELAKTTKKFGEKPLRAALDSSPLWGAGKVEDTYNLLGQALKKTLKLLAKRQKKSMSEIATEMEMKFLGGASTKAGLDINWEESSARESALSILLAALHQLERTLEKQPEAQDDLEIRQTLEVAIQVKTQDVETQPDGLAQLRSGVAPNRRISLEEPEMRHGRKSRSQKFDGYKRHVLRDLDNGLIRAVGVTPANVPEATVTVGMSRDLSLQKVKLAELHIDRAYLTSSWVKERGDDLKIYCKAWSVKNGERFTKNAFVLDWENQTICCPNQVKVTFSVGGVVKFPASRCHHCPLQERCTTSPRGRSISIHPDEKFLRELRERQLTPVGRQQLRERVAVEHSLSHISRIQGKKARYLGVRKNLFDLRRTAVIHNLHIRTRLRVEQQQA